MKALIAAAKAEGTVSVDGPPIDVVREFLTQGFQREYGIAVLVHRHDQLGQRSTRARRTRGRKYSSTCSWPAATRRP